MTRYGVSLGSNLGDRVTHLRSAVREISGFVEDLKVSRLYETAPIGGPEQGPYLNAVISFRSDLGPHDLLSRMQHIEDSHDRVREVRWGPRPLDLDIIVSEEGPFDRAPELIIPHPRAAERLFVIRPMMDVWPEAELSGGVSLDDVYPDVADQEVDLLASDWLEPGRLSAGTWLVAIQILLFLIIGALIVFDGTIEFDGWDAFLGIAFFGVGVGLMLSAAAALGTNLSILPEPVADGGLVAFGPFRWIRHPIYSGGILVFGGVSMALGSTWALVATGVLAVFFYLKAGYEEHQLRIVYPEYRAYIAEVPHRFFPFLV